MSSYDYQGDNRPYYSDGDRPYAISIHGPGYTGEQELSPDTKANHSASSGNAPAWPYYEESAVLERYSLMQTPAIKGSDNLSFNHSEAALQGLSNMSLHGLPQPQSQYPSLQPTYATPRAPTHAMTDSSHAPAPCTRRRGTLQLGAATVRDLAACGFGLIQRREGPAAVSGAWMSYAAARGRPWLYRSLL
ncbi:hypothetical protein FA95DRAFT_1564580 [Auriscalpium vulgare]|uniref:Uncharacterized protein n=1 Tax=Auriscalpium vulgare TaxID=40419 RepID=A0ACB8REZ2_9AGAM|nr:hypothetical protein FA95DRAFT_1564580 [Auriscalpium vulgare]